MLETFAIFGNVQPQLQPHVFILSRTLLFEIGIRTQAFQRNQQIRRREWHIKPLRFYKSNQLHVALDA